MTSLPRLLLLLTLAHVVVDAFASVVQPLWPDLQRGLALGDGAVETAYVFWAMAMSLVQLPLGYWGDRYHGRWLIWTGPAVAVLSISSIGLVDSFGMLCLLLVLGGSGIAAFHPEAATMAGACSPENRSRAMSVFAIGGYLGQAAGPVYSGALTDAFGLPALVWSIAWGLVAVGAVGFALRYLPVAHQPAAPGGIMPRRPGRGRRKAIGLVLAIGSLRVVPAMGVPLALAYVIKAAQGSNTQIGVAQSVFLAAIGVGGVGCAAFVGPATEKLVLWLLPLFSAAILALCPASGYAALLAWVGLAGLVLGVTLPVLVSYGQQLLPEGQRVANSITMGVSWGVASALVAGIMAVFNRLEQPAAAFYAFALAAGMSSLLCAWLPKLP